MSIITPAPSHNGNQVGPGSTAPARDMSELLISRRAEGAVAQSFRLLRANIEAILTHSTNRAIAVVSAHPGDGRSLVAGNLAVAFAEDHRVLLIEEEHGALSRLFRAGASQLRDGIPPELRRSVTETNRPGVYLMQWAEANQDNRYRIDDAIQAAAASDMYTIIDTPPTTLSSDGFLAARKAGNALYVMRAQNAGAPVHRRARVQIERLGSTVLGVVLNEF